MAIEPKSPRKRAVKKSRGKAKVETSTPATEVEEVASAPKSSAKKAPAIPVPIFQAAEVVAPPRAKKAATKKDGSEKSADVEEIANVDGDDSDSRGGRNRRRRRGGRGRRKNQSEDLTTNESSQDGEDSSENSNEEEAEGSTHRRRRRRRASGDGVTPGEVIDEDGVITVVKVREVREKSDGIRCCTGGYLGCNINSRSASTGANASFRRAQLVGT